MAPFLVAIGGGSAAAGAVTVAGVGVSAFAAAKQAEAAKAQAKSAQNIANFNAQVQEQEAAAQRQRAVFEQKRQAKEAARIKSSLTAKIAKAGGLGSPVAEDLAAEQAEELELENLLIGFEGEVGARRSLNQAELDRLSGRVSRQRGKAAVTASRFRTGTTLLQGFGSTT